MHEEVGEKNSLMYLESLMLPLPETSQKFESLAIADKSAHKHEYQSDIDLCVRKISTYTRDKDRKKVF